MAGLNLPVTERIEKSHRAASMCHQPLSITGMVTTGVSLELLDTQILPILTYSWPVWTAPEPNKQVTLSQISLHINNLPVHIRQYVNFKCQKEVVFKIVRKPIQPTPIFSWLQ